MLQKVVQMKLSYLILGLAISLVASATEDSLEFVRERKIGPFVYKMKYNAETDIGQFQILKNRIVVYSQKGSHFFIVPEHSGFLGAGTSLTRKHPHELIVVDWNGGAHCCYTFYLLALEDRPSVIQKIELEHSSIPDFKDLNADGTPEIVVRDWTFAYWKIAFAQSPAPEVVLGFNGEKWVFDPKLNIKPAPTRTYLSKLTKEIETEFVKVKRDASLGDTHETGAPVLLWKKMLDFVHSGNAASAFSLVDSVWPPENKSKDVFLRQFNDQLTKSPYFIELKRINRNSN